ncbi:MAG: hypothetical protein JST93_33945 [Acidobacteria bacterium]|nr:hypothetical protein [Acidobacteriota bacterium]
MLVAVYVVVSLLHTEASGQYPSVRLEAEPVPKAKPKGQMMGRRRIVGDPDRTFPELLASIGSSRKHTFESVGLDYMAERNAVDIRLMAVNLDADEDLERVLIASGPDASQVAVLKKQAGEWWSLGAFSCCQPGTHAPETFLELRQMVWYGTNDIVLHTGGRYGSGIGEHRMRIFRVWNSHLYQVFDIKESAYNWSTSEEAQVTFPSAGAGPHDEVVILVRRTKSDGRRRTSSCELHRWDASQFVFVPIPPSAKLCGK